MAQPTNADITITLNDVDITAFCPFENLSMDLYRRQVSRFSLLVRNPTGVTPTKRQTINAVWNSVTGTPTFFTGYVMEVRSRKPDNGIDIEYELECADKKVLLQKSIVPYNIYTGLDSTILSSLLSNAYPDLSADFDFSTDVTSFANDLNLTTNDDSLLDALNNLADQADADYRFDSLANGGATVTFDTGGHTDYTIINDGMDSASVTTGGNPDNCLKALNASVGFAEEYKLLVEFDATEISEILFDAYYDADGTNNCTVNLSIFTSYPTTGLGFGGQTLTTNDATWKSFAVSTIFGGWSPPYADITAIQLTISFPTSTANVDSRLDNIIVGGGGASGEFLQWDADPDLSDFDIDIDSGDEFAFNIDTFDGDFDDFNSITVIGGFEEVAIDWTYRASGQQNHINLETEVKDVVCYTNGGTDTTPSWGTALTLGTFGTDELTVDGGSNDVLYDPEKHWLLFNSNPPNLENSIRITGSILKPIRVRVEQVADGEPTFATTVTNANITSQEQAIALGNAALKKNNAPARLDFKTHEPGLKPGQQISISDSARGLSQSIVIQSIKINWLGAALALFQVQCGDVENTSAEVIIANNDKRSRQNAVPSAPTLTTVSVLLDDDGNTLTDNDGSILYEVSL